MSGEDRRPSAVLTGNPFIEVTDTSITTESAPEKNTDREVSPVDDFLKWKPHSPKMGRYRGVSETQYADTEVEELMNMLRETESLEEQGDILQYLVGIIANETFCFLIFKIK